MSVAGIPAHAVHAHAVATAVVELDRREVGHHVGRDVRPRIAHLVQDLLGDDGTIDAAAGAVVLRDDERAVGATPR
jgi:hypothetical protein